MQSRRRPNLDQPDDNYAACDQTRDNQMRTGARRRGRRDSRRWTGAVGTSISLQQQGDEVEYGQHLVL